MRATIVVFSFILIVLVGGTSLQADSRESLLREITQLTGDDFERAGEAYFSPDMQWIIFQAIPQGQQHYHMYIAKLTYDKESIRGIEKPIRISPDNSRNTCGYFSPDGTTILFASTAGKEDPKEPKAGFQRQGRNYRWSYPPGMELFLAKDWQEAVGHVEPGGSIDLAKRALTDNAGYDAECAFSPDGKWIVFTSGRHSDKPPPAGVQPDPAAVNLELELYAMRADGTHVVRLTNAPGYDGGPFFSPDGKRIVYRSDRNQNDLLQVFVADLLFDDAGNITGINNERQLTNDENVNWGPFWHPGGRHIIYSTSIHGHTNYELYLTRDDGSTKTRVTYSAGADVLPVFSPDGKYLIWASKRNGKSTQIYVAKFHLPDGN